VSDTKSTIVARLAVERDMISQEQLDEMRAAQKAGAEAMGVSVPLAQILVSKGLLTKDQVQELLNVAAVETGEARLIADYEVISKLGQGGMGAVYKAKSQTTGEFVALKLLPPSMATPQLVQRFEREAKVVSSLDHEHIVGFVEFGFDKRRKAHFCALELVEGEDLDKRIERDGAFTEPEAIAITSQIAGALQHAFQKGLIHRDVKPANIMLTPDGTAKLLDLGLARTTDGEATRLTQSGMFVGSPHYASPEQAMADSSIDTRSDIYSLGATLYYMVTGKPPFEGGTTLSILQKHVSEKLKWPAEANPSLSEGLCRIIARMMAKDPADRYQSPFHVVADLDLLRQGGLPEVGREVLSRSSIAPALGAQGGALRMAAPASELRPVLPRKLIRPPVLDGSHSTEVARRPSMLAPVVGLAAAGLLAVLGFVIFGKEEPTEKPAEKPKTQKAAKRTDQEAGARRAAAKRDPASGEGTALRPAPRASRVGDAKLTHAAPPAKIAQPSGDIRKASPPEAPLRGLDRPTTINASSPGTDTHAATPGAPVDSPVGARPVTTRNAAKAYGEAEEYEHKNPTDKAGIIARFEAIVRDFPETSQAKTAEANIVWLRQNQDAVVAKHEAEKLKKALGQFDAFLGKRDFAAAKKLAENAAAKAHSDSGAQALKSAARVAQALDDRAKAVRRAADALVGKQAGLSTTKGKLAGKVRSVTDEGFTVEISKRMPGGGTIETRMKAAWADLTPKEEDSLAWKGGWRPAGPDEAVILTCVACGRKDKRAALRALAKAGDDPLADHYRAKLMSSAAKSSAGVDGGDKRADARSRAPKFSRFAELQVLTGHMAGVRNAVISPNGEKVFSTANDSTVRIWDTKTGSERRMLDNSGRSLPRAEFRGFSKDSKRLAIHAFGYPTQMTSGLVNVASGAMLPASGWSCFGFPGFAPDGQSMVVPQGYTAIVVSAATGAKLATLPPGHHKSRVYSAAFSRNGRMIVTAAIDRTAIVWDARKRVPLSVLTHEGPVMRADFSSDSVVLVTLMRGGYVPRSTTSRSTSRYGNMVGTVWEVKTARKLSTFSCSSAEFVPNSRMILAVTRGEFARLYNAASGKVACVIPHGSVTCAKPSADGKWIVTGSSDGVARIWQASTGRPVGSLSGHNGPIVAVDISADAHRVITASADSTIRVWGEPEKR